MDKNQGITLFPGETEVASLGWKTGVLGRDKGGILLTSKRILAIEKEKTFLGLLPGDSYTVSVGLESVDSFEYGTKSGWLWRLLRIKFPLGVIERNFLGSRRVLTIRSITQTFPVELTGIKEEEVRNFIQKTQETKINLLKL